jgi:hypothetical protein
MNSAAEQDKKSIQVNRELDNLACLLDGAFKVPFVGWRFGFDFILGLIPTIGDFATALASFYILIAGVSYGVPKITILRMAMNILIDYLIGLIPIIGDILDIFWRANEKNIDLIRKRATAEGAGTTSDYLFVGGIVFVLASFLLLSITLTIWLMYKLIEFMLSLA